MKIKPSDPVVSRNVSSVVSRKRLRVPLTAAAAAVLAAAPLLQAAIIPKADNASPLNQGASWVGGVVPGNRDVAEWNSSVQVNLNNDPLGASLSWAGIQIANPGGPVVIPADTNLLTVGSAGINLMQATKSFTMSNSLAPSASQYWQVGNGQTLDLEGAFTNLIGPQTNNVSQGAALLFSYDSNPSSVAVMNPFAVGTILAASSGTLLNDGALGTGTGNGIIIGTVNDVDYAAMNGANQIMPGAGLGYTANPTGASPGLGNLGGVYDFVTTNSFGGRLGGNLVITAFRFNTPQPNPASSTTFGYGVGGDYGGVGGWTMLMPSGRTLTIGDILVTTNVGISPVVFGAGGFIRMANIPNELLVFQNNPAASLVFQSPVSNRSGGGVLSKMGVGTLEIQAACSYTGGTLIQGGTILIDGAGTLGSGPVTVSPGANFEGQSFTTNFAPVTIASGATNSVLVAIPNGQFVNNTNLALTAGASATWMQFIYSNSIVPGATAALLVTNGTLTVSNTVNVNVLCSGLTVGQFPLIKYVTLVTNNSFPFNLVGIQPHTTAYLSNNVANSSIDLVVTSVTQPLHWAVGSGAWDLVTGNWKNVNGNSTTYQQAFSVGYNDNVLLDDTASGPSPITVSLNSSVSPGQINVNNSAINYTISGSGSIDGVTSLTKTGTGTLALSTANSFSGGVNLNGGIVNFSALDNLGTGSISFNGGTLQYNGNTDDISMRNIILGAGGATIDTAGQNVNFINPIGFSGSGSLTKTGNGTLTMNTTNKYTGLTIVNQGTLALGTVSSPAIIVNSGATLDTATSGVGLTLASGQILAGSGTVSGEVLVPANTTVTPGTNGVFGTLSLANNLSVDGGTLMMDVSTASHDLIAVSGNVGLTNGFLQVNVVGTLPNGVYPLITYGGSLLSGSGSSANLIINGFLQPGQIATLSDATAHEIDLVISTSSSDAITWSGSGTTWDLAGTTDWYLGNTTTPWAYTNGDLVTFNDVGGGSPTVSLEATLYPSSVVVSNNAETYDFRDGTGVGAGRVGGPTSFVKDGTGTMYNETASAYTGSTTIKNGVLQIGNGSIGDIGTGSVTNNASLVFAQGDGNLHKVAGVISGIGSITEQGSAPVALANNNTYSGGTTISSGALQVGAGSAAGSLGTGPVTNNGELFVDRTGSLALSNNISGSGAVAFIGSGTVTYSGTNTYANNTYISNGIVKLGTSSAIFSDGSAGDWLILDGGSTYAGALDLNGHNLAVNAIAGVNNTTNGVIDNNGGASGTTNTLSIVGTATTSYSGAIVDNTGSGGKIRVMVNPGANQTFDVENTSGNNTYSGGTIISNSTVSLTGPPINSGTFVALGTGPITLYNATLNAMGYNNGTPSLNSLANNILLPGNNTNTISGPERGTMQANISGSGTLIYINNYVRGNVSGNWTNFTGQIIFENSSTAGGQIGFAGAATNGFGRVFCTNIAQSAIPAVVMYNTAAGTPTIPFGELADDGSAQIESTTSGNGGGVAANFAVGSLNTSTTFGGSIIDNVGIIKVGTGTWTLTSATLTYSGLTTVSNGVLLLSTNVILTNSSPITIASLGILDVSETSPFELGISAAQLLGGNGLFRGSIVTSTNATIAPGGTNAIGTLTVSGDVNLTAGGTIVMELNGTNASGKNDELVASSIEGGGTLTVTNIGPNLINNTTFTLFSKPVSGFATVTLPATDPTGTSAYVWANNLNVNGSITLVSGGSSGVATNPVPIKFSVSGGNLNLSWPPDHLGWYLQSQTNSLSKGIGTNWVDVPGSSTVTNVVIPIVRTNSAGFYRMSLNP